MMKILFGLSACVVRLLALVGLSSTAYAGTPGTWSEGPNMAYARYYHTATRLASGEVLVAGGFDAFGGSNLDGLIDYAEIFDPGTDQWSSAGMLAQGRLLHTATLLPSGKVLVVGGENLQDSLASAELYDPATNSWTTAAPLSLSRFLHTATLLPSGQVLVAGGRYGYANGVPTPTAELYDPDSDTWTPTGSMTDARYAHTATLLPSGKVLVEGGISADFTLIGAEIYDPDTQTWSAAETAPVEAGGFTTTLLASGQVLAAGGQGDYMNPYVSNSELYDPGTDTWSPAGDLVAGRYAHTATLLQTGEVLVAGGRGAQGLLDMLGSSELFDPASGSWRETGALDTARSEHTATLLDSGEVLVAGGNVATGGEQGVTNTTLLYEPESAPPTDDGDGCFRSGFEPVAGRH